MKYDQSINNARVKQLINTYGANSESWPADEREDAIVLLNNSSELQSMLSSEKQLDNLLAIDNQTTALNSEYASAVTKKVITKVRSKPARAARFIPLLHNFIDHRYAIAFTILFTAGLVVYMSPPQQADVNVAQSEFDRWMLAQVTGVTIEEEAPVELGFMELVELEVDADSNI